MPLPHVLAIDDNHADLELLQIAFEAIGVAVRISRATDGVKACDLIEQLTAKGECPDLILLDLNMPRFGGYAVLEHLRDWQRCKAATVVVLTSSSAFADRTRCQALGAREVITKPAHYDEVIEMVRGFTSYFPPLSPIPRERP